MSAHSAEDFPPYWTPPPQWGSSEQAQILMNVLYTIAAEPAAPWVHSVYLMKFKYWLENRPWHPGDQSWDEESLAAFIQYLNASKAKIDEWEMIKHIEAFGKSRAEHK
jgi:hypothetical protein